MSLRPSRHWKPVPGALGQLRRTCTYSSTVRQSDDGRQTKKPKANTQSPHGSRWVRQRSWAEGAVEEATVTGLAGGSLWNAGTDTRASGLGKGDDRVVAVARACQEPQVGGSTCTDSLVFGLIPVYIRIPKCTIPYTTRDRSTPSVLLVRNLAHLPQPLPCARQVVLQLQDLDL